MCGKIPQCSVSQATSNKLHAAITNPVRTRAIQRNRAVITAPRGRKGDAAAVTGATMDMNELGSRKSARQSVVQCRAGVTCSPGEPALLAVRDAAAI
jgi:hypothetical protein